MAHRFECAAAECSKVSNHTYASNLKLTICHCWHMRNAFSNRKPEGPPDGISDFWGSAAYLLPIRSLSAGIAFKNIFLGRCFFETKVAIPGIIIYISQTQACAHVCCMCGGIATYSAYAKHLCALPTDLSTMQVIQMLTIRHC